MPIIPSKKIETSTVPLQTTVLKELIVAVAKMSSNRISVLFNKSPKSLAEYSLFDMCIQEMQLNVPFLYDILNNLLGDNGNKLCTMALIYSMIINSRNKQASALQRLMTVIAIKGHADNKLLGRLNKLHITMSAESKPHLITEFASYCEERIVNEIKSKKDGKINGDNLDIFVATNDIRMDNKNRDYHFFASDWTPFRLTNEDFSSNNFIREMCSTPTNLTVCLEKLQPDIGEFKRNIKFLVARELIKILPKFKWMELVVPSHLEHPLQEIMSRKTTSYGLPIQLKNEAKYGECVQIMDSYEQQIASWYQKAGRSMSLYNI